MSSAIALLSFGSLFTVALKAFPAHNVLRRQAGVLEVALAHQQILGQQRPLASEEVLP